MGKDASLNRFKAFFGGGSKDKGQASADIWRVVTAVKTSGPKAFVSDLREKPESTDHMEWLQGRVRAKGRQKWQPLIFVPWSLGNTSL